MVKFTRKPYANQRANVSDLLEHILLSTLISLSMNSYGEVVHLENAANISACCLVPDRLLKLRVIGALHDQRIPA